MLSTRRLLGLRRLKLQIFVLLCCGTVIMVSLIVSWGGHDILKFHARLLSPLPLLAHD